MREENGIPSQTHEEEDGLLLLHPPLRLGHDLLLTDQVARLSQVSRRTVERWIRDTKLPALKASQTQIGELIQRGLLTGIPPSGVYLIRATDLHLIDRFRTSAGRPPGHGRETVDGAGRPDQLDSDS